MIIVIVTEREQKRQEHIEENEVRERRERERRKEKMRERAPSVCRVQNVSVCRFKTLPCVPAKRAHVEQHARVLPVHTEAF